MAFSKHQLLDSLPQSNKSIDEDMCGKKELGKAHGISHLASCWQDYFLLYNLQDLAIQYQVQINCITQPNCKTVYQYYQQVPKSSTDKTITSVGTCIIVHGYMDHSGLYQHLIRDRLLKGWDVLIYDLQGHGLSSGEVYAIDSFTEYAEQLQQVLAFLAISDKSNNWVLIGQSTGCAIIMEHSLNPLWRSAAQVKNRILLAPLLKNRGFLLVRIQYYLLKLIVNEVKRKPSDNSHDQNFLDFIRNKDPLTNLVIKVNWVGAMLAWQQAFITYKQSSDSILVIQGDDDGTVDWRYNLPEIAKKFKYSQQVIISGGKHHLVNESDVFRGRVFDAIGD
jgi:alpha-beta hydrolase superfamily lysophospholipase